MYVDAKFINIPYIFNAAINENERNVQIINKMRC